jgi:DNA-binding PucR family transcriptional regulator
VDRHTVQRRLRKVEEALGRLLHSCHAELEVALVLEELDKDTALPNLSAVGSG